MVRQVLPAMLSCGDDSDRWAESSPLLPEANSHLLLISGHAKYYKRKALTQYCRYQTKSAILVYPELEANLQNGVVLSVEFRVCCIVSRGSGAPHRHQTGTDTAAVHLDARAEPPCRQVLARVVRGGQPVGAQSVLAYTC